MYVRHYLLAIGLVLASAAPGSAAAATLDEVCPKGPYVDLVLQITKKAETSTSAADKAAYATLLAQLKQYPAKCEKYAKARGGS